MSGDAPDEFRPFKAHVEVDSALEPDTVIWRYMGLNSFFELLAGYLVMSRADRLNDALEGAYGWRQVEFANEFILALNLPLQKRIETEYGRHYPYITHEPQTIIPLVRRSTFLSCWTEFNYESFALWKLYGRFRDSVAIASTVGKLEALSSFTFKRYGKAPLLNFAREIRTL